MTFIEEKIKKKEIPEIWGSHGSEDVICGFLGCDAM
jgi:hypothetical protein